MTAQNKVEKIKDWIETCLDVDAHGKWVRAPKFEILEDVADLMAPWIVEMLSQREKEFAQKLHDRLEGEKRLTHDLKQSLNPCTFFTDHEPVWDGNYYTCAKWIEFLPAREVNITLSRAQEIIKEVLGE